MRSQAQHDAVVKAAKVSGAKRRVEAARRRNAAAPCEDCGTPGRHRCPQPDGTILIRLGGKLGES